MCSLSSVEDVWEIVRDQVSIPREEFFSQVRSLKLLLGDTLNDKAIAIMVAKRLGADVSEIFSPPLKGRVLELGPIRERGGNVYRTFTLVNPDRRYFCTAFGREHVDLLGGLEERCVKISGYVIAQVGQSEIIRVTEKSRIVELPDDSCPGLLELPTARAPSIAFIKSNMGPWIFTGVIVYEEYTENLVCPICKKPVELVDSEWICREHGEVEPETRRVYRYRIADKTGIYKATFYGEPPQETLENIKILAKGRARGDEILITKIYKAEVLPLPK